MLPVATAAASTIVSMRLIFERDLTNMLEFITLLLSSSSSDFCCSKPITDVPRLPAGRLTDETA